MKEVKTNKADKSEGEIFRLSEDDLTKVTGGLYCPVESDETEDAPDGVNLAL